MCLQYFYTDMTKSLSLSLSNLGCYNYVIFLEQNMFLNFVKNITRKVGRLLKDLAFNGNSEGSC